MKHIPFAFPLSLLLCILEREIVFPVLNGYHKTVRGLAIHTRPSPELVRFDVHLK